MKWLPLVGFVFLGASALASANYETGLQEYQRGHYASAIHEWRTAAERGNADSQFALGMMFERGQGVGASIDEAYKWYRLAADNGLADAQVRLAELYLLGRLEGEPSSAAQWFERAATSGSAAAQFQLGLLYLEGEGVDADSSIAARWFELAAEQGHVAAQNNIGSLYETGRGVEQSFTRAFEWYEQAAKQNDPFAQNNLGAMHARGQGVERNHAWAVFWFVMAAQGGNDVARENIEASLPNLEEKKIVGSSVNIRSGASTNFDRIASLTRGTSVYVLGSMDGWSQVYFQDNGLPTLGWVSNTLIE
ncbi:SH3 domain-containing protein [Halomonas qaidamensis]|uniref:SH3 domain-containing protein n=1 Tax=Halomonas qaidamensis TaxID=2866211 RepID=A0ABY6JMM3_9GAMM|nr:SH3 domain-containing protein [Halomonas qaidamensis]UYV18508.1 SH3 domain-containing protein [Halomonas qaidamensis]